MLTLFGAIACLLWLGCSGREEVRPVGSENEAVSADPAPAAEPLAVFAVNYPLAYFAERIGGGNVDVVFPAPPGIDPSLWSPDAETVAAFQAADLILLNGANYAKWTARVSLPASRSVDTSAALADRLVPLEAVVTHSHGPSGEHSHAGWASTIWLDPTLALEMGIAIRDALVELRPLTEDAFNAGLGALETDLRQLDRDLEAALTGVVDRPMLFSHPVYQYLIARYGLDARSLHWEPTEMPDEKAWDELAAMRDHHPAETILWEAEPLPATRRRLEDLGLRVLVYDPAADRPAEGDWLSVMRSNLAALRILSPEL